MSQQRIGPPAWATRLLALVIRPEDRAEVIAEMDELYAMLVARRGRGVALRWYLRQTAGFPLWGFRVRAVGDMRHAAMMSRRTTRLAWSSDVARDVRAALRGLRRSPSFAVVALATIALGFGLNSAVFSVVNGVVLRPLPYPESHRLVRLWPEWAMTKSQYDIMAERTAPLVEMSGFATDYYSLPGQEGGVGQTALGLSVTPNHFAFFGVEPVLGRTMTPDDADAPVRPVWLGRGLWRSHFGGDSAIVGRPVDVALFTALPMTPGAFAGERFVVAGVMPAGFEPFGQPPDLWFPLHRPAGSESYQDFGDLQLLGRLATGVTIAELEPMLSALLQQEIDARDEPHAYESRTVLSLHRTLVGDVRPVMLVTLAAVGLVLLAACVNLAMLMLVRGERRGRELAVKMALGAGRGRLVRQLVTEAVTIAVLGGLLGWALAHAALPALVAALPGDLPRMSGIALDGMALTVAGLALVAGVGVFGVLPALKALPTRWATRGGGLHSGDRPGAMRTFRWLIAAELALALVLTIGAGLLLNSFWRLTHVNPGFVPDGVVATQLAPSARHFADVDRRRRFFHEVVARVGDVPGVEDVGAIHRLPMWDQGVQIFYRIPGLQPSGDDRLVTQYRIVTPDYFETMGIPLLRGRDFGNEDRTDSRAVGIINQAMARRHWPDQDPLGQEFRRFNGDPWFTVVGVVGDVRQFRQDQPSEPEVYLPLDQAEWASAMAVVVRSTLPPGEVTRAISTAASEIDPSVPMVMSRSMGDVLAARLERERFYLQLFALFGALSVVLSGIGVYGVMAHAVTQRRREIGVRLALGASAARVTRTMLGKVALAAGAGLLAGMALALAGGRTLDSLLYQVGAADPLVVGSVTMFLGLVALLAGWLPARRAARVDPMTTLRSE